MRMRFRSLPDCLAWKVGIAAGAAMLILGMLPRTAGAAGIKTTFPLIDGVTCFGNLSGSKDATDMPNGDFVALGAFSGLKKTDTSPAAAKAGTISWVWGVAINAACTDLDSNGKPGPTNFTPCGQEFFASGTYNPVTVQGPKIGTMNVTFSDAPSINGAPAEPTGADPFDGCSAQFESYPDRTNSSARFALTPPGITGSCKMAGSHITMVCRLE